jgi:hypothetical protein
MLPGEAIYFVLHRLQPPVRNPQVRENDELNTESILEILQSPAVLVGDMIIFNPVVKSIMQINRGPFISRCQRSALWAPSEEDAIALPVCCYVQARCDSASS